MATDIYVDPTSNDLFFNSNYELRLTATLEELTRQRLSIRLKLFQGEWKFDETLGTPYFQTIYGKSTKIAADLAIKTVILDTEGVIRLTDYTSVVDKSTRKLTVNFSCIVESGEIVTVEEVL